MKTNFTWTSSLGLSAAMFITIAVTYILISVLGIIIVRFNSSGGSSGQIYFGGSGNEVILGKSSTLMKENPALGKYFVWMMFAFCSFMLTTGILQFGVARFALIKGEPWAFWFSVISNLLMLGIYWLMIILPYMKAFNLSYWSTWHPYAFIPTILLLPAIVLGWLGLKN